MTEARVTRHWWSATCFSVLLLAVFGGGATQAEPLGGLISPGSKAADMDQCVEPSPVMRRNHMEFIRHQQGLAVYSGIRGTKYSLDGCVNCHAGHDPSGQPVAVNVDGQFCNSCHVSAAVQLNCFECHATIPAGEAWNQLTAGGQTVAPEAHGHLEGDSPALHHLPGDALAQLPSLPETEESDDR